MVTFFVIFILKKWPNKADIATSYEHLHMFKVEAEIAHID